MRAREITARRYAKALHALARETGATDAVGRELDAYRGVWAADAQLRDVLTRPWLKPADRRSIAVAVAQQAGAGQPTQRFVGLLAERGRLDHLSEIVAAYRALVDEDQGQARAQVRTRVPLTVEEKRQLGARLEQAVGKRIIIEEQADPTLLGGFVAQIGSFVVDGSLDGQLARMRERLARG
ncbi:MAG TPA: ATP synthase F1 subunit delta [Methylomirabilota bacterium]|nr:ATP synthase F1 subunit delta [Methylomirabilota bacterium]